MVFWTAVPVVVLVVVAVAVVWPGSSASYRGVALSAAEEVLAQVRTVRLMVDADADGRILPSYRSAVLWQARESLASAQGDLVGEEVPDPESVTVHDELQALVSEAGSEIGAADTAEGSGLRVLVDRLGVTGDRLSDFLARYR
ncbi:hypothetical protein H074_12247 [Amycolatopsis decaplanina DSM 44594]|uniref:Uncharacterized protein n=1 Tax=Amycolatopsis decaplanina DSM 44594 TaxID=1284240 RepID=M2ZKK5_9PSEU|nr:hypothetical protein H074_12247 [Amycolatopsis decaplanina DSM 44594]